MVDALLSDTITKTCTGPVFAARHQSMLTAVLLVGRTGRGSLQLDAHHRGAVQSGVGQHISTRGDALLLLDSWLDCCRALVGSSPQQQLWMRPRTARHGPGRSACSQRTTDDQPAASRLTEIRRSGVGVRAS